LTNNPKDADLDYDAAALKQSIRLEGIVTVGDLVARVGQAAGLEMYADRRYEKRTVTLVGRRTARGVDLLRAAAFCVTGTFRKVGPAYVLTDDREGAAPRRLRLTRFVQEAEGKRHAAVSAGDSLVAVRGGVYALPLLDSLDLGLSDAQKARPEYQPYYAAIPVRVPFAQLTPAQQGYVTDTVRRYNEASDRDAQAKGTNIHLTLGGQFQISAEPTLLLLSPAVPGPIAFVQNFLSLYQPSLKLQGEMGRRRAAAKDPPAAKPPPPAALLAPLSRRAVLVAPRTVRELDQVITGMKALGLNQLWLEVFAGGHSRLGASPDLLTEALARTKGTGIAVVPALDLLRWGVDAPAGALDLNALGETSAQQQAWEGRLAGVVQDAAAGDAAQAPPADVWACPAAPAVEQTLLALVRHLAVLPGVTTVALNGTVPPGYDPTFGSSSGDLGYVLALRLALLRRDHVDPLDLDTGTVLPDGADVSLPEFGDGAGDALKAGDAAKDWNDLRDTAGRDLLRRLLAAAQDTGSRRLRFLVPQRGNAGTGGWYGLWDDPHALLPEVPPPGPFDPLHPPWKMDYAQIAHSRSRIALYALPAWATGNPYIVADMLQKLKPGWDGVVLDATGPPEGGPLADLARGTK